MRAAEMIQDARDLLNDPDGDFWTDEKLLRHLNRSLRDVSGRTRTIRETFYYQVNAKQATYGLPDGFLGNDKVAWLYQGEWYPLKRRKLAEVESLNNSQSITTWRPFYYDIWGRGRVEKYIVEAIENPVSPDADNSGEVTFFSSAPLFGVKRFDVIVNMTDGSEGIVRELSQGFSQVVFEDLTGGTNNRIEVGDQVRITSHHVFPHVLRVSPPPNVDSEIGEEVLWVYLSRRHYEVMQDHIDVENDTLELDVELETVALERFLYWCRREELGAEDPASQVQLTLYLSELHSAMPRVLQRNREHESMWGSPSTDAYRYQNIGLEGITTTDGHALNNQWVR